eukprot:15639-Pelagococcus_subviridis.AAC.1
MRWGEDPRGRVESRDCYPVTSEKKKKNNRAADRSLASQSVLAHARPHRDVLRHGRGQRHD